MATIEINELSFTPENGYEDSGEFPNPSSGTQAREQLMSMPNQIKAYINTTLHNILSTGDYQQVLVKGEGDTLEWFTIGSGQNPTSFSVILGSPTDNANLSAALDEISNRTEAALFKIEASNWGDREYISDTYYYKNVVPIGAIYDYNPIIGLGADPNSTDLPTSSEQIAYEQFDFCVLNDDDPTDLKMILYAESLPGVDFYILAKGIAERTA